MTSQVIFSENGLKSPPQFQEKWKNITHGSVFALNVKFIEKSVILLCIIFKDFLSPKLNLIFNFWVFPDDAEPLGQHTGSRHGKRHRVIPARKISLIESNAKCRYLKN